jgi:very-short-patch-repair endonuclease
MSRLKWHYRSAHESLIRFSSVQFYEADLYTFPSVETGSETYGLHNFGPLNGENGWRRLNVLVTRARHRMRVFSSMRGDEISSAATTSRGAHLLREFLYFAERGRLESVSANLAAEAESPFEQEVIAALVNRGITVVPQVGVAGYRIDIGVLDDGVPGRYVCGIECDGVAYHQSETARDRDRLRQQVLEARGWIIHRAWSTDWFKDRQGQIERLVRLIEESRERARATITAEREARELAVEAESKRRAEEAEAAMQEPARLRDGGASEASYRRPIAEAYAFAPGDGAHAGSDLLNAPLSQLVNAAVIACGSWCARSWTCRRSSGPTRRSGGIRRITRR